ncbi:MAG TPA: type I polyketide synthase, partial [Longimicrobium sp.]
ALAELQVPSEVKAELGTYQIHPAVLDLCFQVLAAALPFPEEGSDTPATVYMPTGVDEGVLYGRATAPRWIHARISEQGDHLLRGDIRLLDAEGRVLLEIDGCRAVSLRDDRSGPARAQEFYELAWRPQPLAPVEEPSRAAGSWLVLADRGGVGAEVSRILEARGERCVQVLAAPGEPIAEEAGRWRIDPSQPAHFQELLERVDGERSLRGVIHLWSLDAASPDGAGTAELAEAEALGCGAVLFLVQALAGREWRRAPRLWLATRGAQAIIPGDAASVLQAPLWGMGRSIGHQEHMELWGGVVDLDPRAAAAEAAAQLVADAWESDGEDQVAFRDGERYVARLAAADVPPLPLPPTFRPDAAYLITGGLGGLGLLVARWMVERGARRLVLLGREKLPPREEWSQAEAGGRLATRIAAIRELEAMGASVHLAAADVSDEAELRAALEKYEREGWPAIRGVVHSAGVARPQLMVNMEADDFRSALRPKVSGGWLLHRLFEDRPLDFFVLFSSVASVVVSAGQGNYAAGNSFLDSLAHYRRSRGLPGLSINWGPWAEVGMATQLDLLEFFERRGLYQMTPEQGLHALASLMNGGATQTTVLGAEWPVVAERNYPMGRSPAMLRELLAAELEAADSRSAGGEGDFVAQLLAAGAEEQPTMLTQHLKEMAAFVLRLEAERFEAGDALTTLGLDSMMAIELKNRMEHGLGVSVAVVELLKGASVAELAGRILPQLLEREAPMDAEAQAILEQIQQLSPEQVEELLASAQLGATT